METKSTQPNRKKYTSIITTGIAVLIGFFIVSLLFFKFMPGYNFYVVRSGSMTPAIGVGNIVFTGPVGNIAPGSVITFNKNGETVTHRVFSINNGQITTKGDANNAPDEGAIGISDIKGAYLFQVPGIGYLTQLASTKKGWFLLVIVPSMLLILFLVKDILKEVFKTSKKKNAAAANTVTAQTAGPAKAVSQNPTSKKSFFSFILFNNEGPKPAQLSPAASAARVSGTAAAHLSAAPKAAVASGAGSQVKGEKKSFFSFLMFNTEEVKPTVKAAPRISSPGITSQEPIRMVVDPEMPAAVNMSSTTYQNISSPEVASSYVAPEKKASKRPFYSFLLFDDETQKAPVVASTASNQVTTKTAPRPVVVDYPAAPDPAPAPVNPVASAPAAAVKASQTVSTPETSGIVVESVAPKSKTGSDMSWLEFGRQPVMPVKDTIAEQTQAIPADSVYIRKEQPKAQPAASKASPAAPQTKQAEKKCVFTNQEVHDQVKNELKKLLNNYN